MAQFCMCHRNSWTCLGPNCQHSEGKPWGQWCDLRHVSTLSKPQFSLLSKGEMASTSLRASPWDEKSRRKVPSHLHRKPLEGCFDSAGPHPGSQSSETILWKESNIQKVPALRREAVGPGSLLVYPKAAATTAAPAPGPSACLALSQGWGEGPGHCWKQTLCLCGHGLLFQGQGSEG